MSRLVLVEGTVIIAAASACSFKALTSAGALKIVFHQRILPGWSLRKTDRKETTASVSRWSVSMSEQTRWSLLQEASIGLLIGTLFFFGGYTVYLQGALHGLLCNVGWCCVAYFCWLKTSNMKTIENLKRITRRTGRKYHECSMNRRAQQYLRGGSLSSADEQPKECKARQLCSGWWPRNCLSYSFYLCATCTSWLLTCSPLQNLGLLLKQKSMLDRVEY